MSQTPPHQDVSRPPNFRKSAKKLETASESFMIMAVFQVLSLVFLMLGIQALYRIKKREE